MFCVNYVTIVSFIPETWNLTMLKHCYCVGVTIDVPEFLSPFFVSVPETWKYQN
jgi:hypothetical protein